MTFEIFIPKVTIDYELLRDYNFLKRFEGIRDVSAFIYLTLNYCKINGGSSPIPVFDKLGIKTLEEYLNLLNSGNWKAIKYYEMANEVLRRHPSYRGKEL